MNYYFTADPHFAHKNIVRYTNRPVLRPGDLDKNGDWISEQIAREKTIEMDEITIHNWNSTVQDNDVVHLIGDLCFGNESTIAYYLRRLKGNIKIVFGNHDKTLRHFAKNVLKTHSDLSQRIEFLGDYAETEINDQHIVLFHYAGRVWNRSHHGSWQLYGHSHNTLPDDPHALAIDVGIDCHNYTPISFDQIKAIMAKKFYVPIDHHGALPDSGGIGLGKAEYAKKERYRQYLQLKKEFKED